MTTRLVIVGAGGLGREVAEAVKAVNRVQPTYELLGYVDDRHADRGSEIEGVGVLGAIDEVVRLGDVQLVVCTGSQHDNFSRKRIVARLGLPPERYAVVVHPAASVAETCTLGPGTVVLAGNVFTAAVTLGSHVAVMPGCVLTHDDVIGDYVTIASGVLLGGDAVVEEGAFVGMGAMVREQRRVGAWALVGAGAQVTRDVAPGDVVVGSPARAIRNRAIPDDVR
jgi:sugar O-acyltransferase (sialic acid O-acetyltransferase NeuD family)